MPTAHVTLAARFHALPAPPLESSLELCQGDYRDYEALASMHYRDAKPATIARVIALRCTRADCLNRFTSCATPIADSGRATEAVAVLVESRPVLHLAMREYALGDRYRALPDMRRRAAMVNAELRCISRVIVHPQWRGLGLATRLVRHALDTATTTYTEALAAMGHVHPFFARAGMTAYERPPLEMDARLRAALRRAGFDALDLARPSHIESHLRATDDTRRTWLLNELRRWYRRAVRRSKRDATVRQQLGAARARLVCPPVYYLHRNSFEMNRHRAQGTQPTARARAASPASA